MTRLITLCLFFAISVTMNAQQETRKQALKKTINRFFEGLHQGDSTIMSATLHKDLKIQTTFTNREQKHILRTETREQLLANVAKKKSTDVYEEKLLSWKIEIDGNLASVWTPYEFYLNGNFSHCGANSFQLFDNDGKWEIIYLVDMRRRSGCNALKDKK